MTGIGEGLQPGPRKGGGGRAAAYIHGWETKPRVCCGSVEPRSGSRGAANWWQVVGAQGRESVGWGALSLHNSWILYIAIILRTRLNHALIIFRSSHLAL